MIRIVNAETGEVIEREPNAAELAQQEADQAEIKALKDAEKAKEATKSALLERLGITADEAVLLLG